jgi:hypothetical protein
MSYEAEDTRSSSRAYVKEAPFVLYLDFLPRSAYPFLSVSVRVLSRQTAPPPCTPKTHARTHTYTYFHTASLVRLS